MTEEEILERRWKLSTIDAFKSLEDDGIDATGWLVCKGCNVLPRVWTFNNGSFAKCLCSNDKYRESEARSESIGSVLKRTGGFVGYSTDNLRYAWNKFVATGEKQTELPEGQW